jgi:hypothetical protein
VDAERIGVHERRRQPGDRVPLLSNVSTSLSKAGPTCTAALQESANGGKSWKTVSASHALPAPANAIVVGFTAAYADGTGHLARVCITLASKQHCSKGW